MFYDELKNFPFEDDTDLDLELTKEEKNYRKSKVKNMMKMAILSGEIMLQSGGETYRVEDTIVRLCKAVKEINYVDVFVIPTGIFLTIGYDNNVNTLIKRTKIQSIDLTKISLVNQFSREFVTTNLSVEQGTVILNKIRRQKPYSLFVRSILGGGFVSGFSALLNGGFLQDFLGAFFVSAIAVVIREFLNYKLSVISYVKDFFGAFFSTIFAIAFVGVGIGSSTNIMIIGSIMPLLPGLATTNATRDSISGDFLSGMSRGIEAILCALSIALGVGVVLHYYNLLF